jgi:GGDEF domain-containing protein
MRVGDRVLGQLARTRLPAPWESIVLSASVGVAMSEANRIPLEALDRALYQVKTSGKGRVCLVDSVESPVPR